MNICVIPARGGSKRIPQKNIRPFCGKPMISYALELALTSGLFDSIIVSSDDCKILNLCQTMPQITGLERPPELSGDEVPTAPVVRHAISKLQVTEDIDTVCCLYPCVPLLKKEILIDGYIKLRKNIDKFVFPVIEFPSPIERALFIDEYGLTKSYAGNAGRRTQDFTPYFYDAGQFYFGSKELWMNESVNIHDNAYPIIISTMDAVDIDNISDWELAEQIYLTRA